MNRRRRTRHLLSVAAVLALGAALPACGPELVMGRGRNFLGTSDNSDNGNTLTGTAISTSARDNFWLSVGGSCIRRERGELIAAYADNTGATTGGGNANDSPRHSCRPGDEGGPAYVRKNPAYRSTGYLYRIHIPADTTGPTTVQAYDPGYCPGSGAPDGNSGYTGQRTQFALYAPGSGTPLAIHTWDQDGGDALLCSAANGQRSWFTLATFTAPLDGADLVLHVRALAPENRDVEEYLNQFALRAFTGTAMAPCADSPEGAPSGSGIAAAAACPTIAADGPIGVYIDLSGSTPRFPVGRVSEDSGGRTLDIELFDAAEGSLRVELLDPLGQAVTFTAEVACQDSTYATDTGIDCPTATGETPPTEVAGWTYGPWTTALLDICGPKASCGQSGEGGGSVANSAAQPWGFQHLIQRTQYNDRTIRLRTTLPADLTAAYGTNREWTVRYTTGTQAASDRLTMIAEVT